MIYDKIDNLELYKDLSPDIYEGLKFLQQVNPDIAVGTYQLTSNIKAIVSEYTTKKVTLNPSLVYSRKTTYLTDQTDIRTYEVFS